MIWAVQEGLEGPTSSTLPVFHQLFMQQLLTEHLICAR